jgi:non-ribosomal peptide synthase protein (TIGR01720 family)
MSSPSTCQTPKIWTPSSPQDLDTILTAVTEQVREVPQRGLGYGLLRAADETLAVSPPITFTYHPPLPDDALFNVTDVRRPCDHTDKRIHLDAGVLGKQLVVEWHCAPGLYGKATIEHLNGELIAALGTVIEHCHRSDTVQLTPSDFPDADLDQETLDRLLADLGG